MVIFDSNCDLRALRAAVGTGFTQTVYEGEKLRYTLDGSVLTVTTLLDAKFARPAMLALVREHVAVGSKFSLQEVVASFTIGGQ